VNRADDHVALLELLASPDRAWALERVDAALTAIEAGAQAAGFAPLYRELRARIAGGR